MLVSTEGIVLRQYPFSDTSIIVKMFTRDYGLVSFIVKGAKSKKNTKAQLYKPINLLAISFYKKENQGLKQIKEVQLVFAPDAQIFGVYKSAITMFMVELINHTIPEDSGQPEIEKYDFIAYSINYLRDHTLNSHFYLSFMYRYSSYLGIEIPLETIPGYENLADYSSLVNLAMSKGERQSMFHSFESHFLENLTQYKSLKSIDILNEILI